MRILCFVRCINAHPLDTAIDAIVPFILYFCSFFYLLFSHTLTISLSVSLFRWLHVCLYWIFRLLLLSNIHSHSGTYYLYLPYSIQTDNEQQHKLRKEILLVYNCSANILFFFCCFASHFVVVRPCRFFFLSLSCNHLMITTMMAIQ